MSYTPPHPPSDPMSGFTVDPRMIPQGSALPKRPTSVTVASWMLVGLGGLGVIASIFALLALLRSFTSGGIHFAPGLLVPVVAAIIIVLALTIRLGYDAVRIATIGLLGGLAFYAVTMSIRIVLTDLTDTDPEYGGLRAGDVVGSLIAVVVAAFAVAVIVLLVGAKATDWFHTMRSARVRLPSAPPSRRPGTVLIGCLLLVAQAVLTIVYFVIAALTSSGTGTDSLRWLLPSAVGDLIILIVLTVAIIMLAIGNDIGRYVAFGLSGYLALAAIAGFFSFIDVALRVPQYLQAFQILYVALYFLQGAVAILTFLVLAGRATNDWFHSRRTPPADAPPVAPQPPAVPPPPPTPTPTPTTEQPTSAPQPPSDQPPRD